MPNNNPQNIVRYVRTDPALQTIAYNPTPAPVAQHQLSLVDIWGIVNRRKVAILLFTTLVFSLAAIYTFTKKPIYESVARLQVDPTRSSSNLGLDENDRSDSLNEANRTKTEVAIIESNTVALQVIQALQLYANPAFAGKDTVTKPMASVTELDPALRQRLLSDFDDNLAVKVLPDTQVIEIRFRSASPAIAMDVSNSIIQQYMERNFKTRVDGTMQVSQWVSKQLEDIRDNTTIAQEKLAEFQKQNNLLGADESDNIVTDRLKQLNEELTQAEADRIVKEGRYRLALSGNPELIASVVPDSTLQTLRNQQADLQGQYDQLNAKFGSGYPKVREMQAQLAAIATQIQNEGQNVKIRLENEYNGAAKTETMIRDDFDKQKTDAFQLDEHVGQYSILKHDVESGQQLYDTLQLKLKEAGITSGLNASYVDIIDNAQLPDKPVAPRTKLNLTLGLGAGLFGGLLLGFVLDSFDDSIYTSAQLENVSALRELVTIPYARSFRSADAAPLKPGTRSTLKFSPLCLQKVNSPATEAYRTLCSTILLSAQRNPLKVIAVTSAMAGEGKSTVSSNLATALAQRNRRVILIDADLRCSSLTGKLGEGPGLSRILSGSAEYHLCQPFAELPNFHVIPAGSRPVDPTKLLDSIEMQTLIERCRTEYDHVIIDTPPLLPFADALAVGAQSDGVVLVTRSDVGRTKALLRARDVLLNSGASIIGFVLNAVRNPEYFYDYPAGYRAVVDDYGRQFEPRKEGKA